MATAGATAGGEELAVLVIDDEDYVADMIAAVLDIEGYAVYVAYNGHDGLLKAQSLRVDLLIVDIMMPYLSGVALIEQIRGTEHLREVPVVLISAGARPPRPLDKVTFVPKPFDIDRMINLVEAEIGRPGGMA